MRSFAGFRSKPFLEKAVEECNQLIGELTPILEQAFDNIDKLMPVLREALQCAHQAEDSQLLMSFIDKDHEGLVQIQEKLGHLAGVVINVKDARECWLAENREQQYPDDTAQSQQGSMDDYSSHNLKLADFLPYGMGNRENNHAVRPPNQ